MPTKSLEAGTYEVTWTLSGYDTLTARIKVESTGVTCLSVTGGSCDSARPPGVVRSGFTVTGYLKPAPVAPTTGYLKVNSSPTGATVKADGTSCGTTPVTACELTAGTYTVTLTKSGYGTKTRTATITAGQTTDLGTIALTATGGGGGGAPTEITKSEFLAELNKRGAIDLSKIGSSVVWNEWYYTGGYLRYRSYGIKIAIGDLDKWNPPTQDSYIDFWDGNWNKIDKISRSWALAQIDKLPFVGGAPPAEMAKSEFFAELQKRGAIDTSKLPTDSGPNKWYYKNGAARYSGGGYGININALTYANPPSDASFIEFLGERGYVGSLPRDYALARLNELPFVSGGGGGAPPAGRGYLTVNTSPAGATVKADGTVCGVTPVVRCSLTAGTYAVTITKTGYEPVTRTITIAAGQTTNIGPITLTPTGGGGGGAPKSFDEWVASKGGKDALKLADVYEIANAFIGLTSLGFTITLQEVYNVANWFIGLP